MDPPWWYAARLRGEGRSKFGEGASGHYGCMKDEELMALGPLLLDILDDQAVVFMWATGARLDFAIDLGRHWGLNYSTKAFSWYKTTLDGQSFRNLPGTYSASNTEDVLLFTYNRRKSDNKLTVAESGGKKMVNQVIWEWAEKGDEKLNPDNGATTAWRSGTRAIRAPLDEHSKKPDDVHKRIDLMYPNETKLEMFARRVWRPDWAHIGNEIDGLDIRDALQLAAGGYYDIERKEMLVG